MLGFYPAIENGWELDWARPEEIDRYLPRGTTVPLNSQSGKVVRLPVPITVQGRWLHRDGASWNGGKDDSL